MIGDGSSITLIYS